MIPIGPMGGDAAKAPGRGRDPYRFWEQYFREHDESPGALLEKVAVLRKEKQFKDVDAAIRGYLVHRTKRAEPWMYEMLAVAVEEQKGSPAEVRTLLGYGAFKAIQSKIPDQLLSVADLLIRRGIFDKVGPPGQQTSAGELIDMVVKQVPHRFEPLVLSMGLASKTKDPKRMGDAVEALLSLGWPGRDEPLRRGARQMVEDLAKALRDDGRGPEADALLARLPDAMARDVYVRLSWAGKDDIDLLVDEPLGATAQLFKCPRTIFGGAIVTNGFGTHPEEVYVCPRGFDGTYTVRVEKIYQPDAEASKTAEVEIITHERTSQEQVQRYTIDLVNPKPITFKLQGGRRKDVLPFMPDPPKPPVLIDDTPKGAARKIQVAPRPTSPPR